MTFKQKATYQGIKKGAKKGIPENICDKRKTQRNGTIVNNK